jgi:HAMP domain-containing protein
MPDQKAEIERLGAQVRRLTQLLDAQNGTPCEQIRHAQEVERLMAEIEELRAEVRRLTDNPHIRHA